MATGARRTRGEIEVLPSGSRRVRVYSGKDPVTGRRHYLTEVVPAGPKAAALAERARTRLLNEVDERRNPRTGATVDQLLDRYLSVLSVEDITRAGYERILRLHVRPVIGSLPLARVDGEVIDSLYAELRRCRVRCDRRPRTDHRTDVEHDCDDRCRPHRCKSMGAATLRHVHTVLNGAFNRAVRWRWLGTNPIQQADAPPVPPADPDPPSPAEAARILTEAWKDPAWGMFVWLAMTTGARRGELCALGPNRIEVEAGVVDIRYSVSQLGKRVWQKDTKTHQRRRIVVDPHTLGLLQAFLRHRTATAAALGIDLAPDAYLFSGAPDGSTPPRPDSVSQRYTRMCKRLGLDAHLHQLRHYSATELIAAGVDIRTVAGRLGHGGGGSTTLRVYSAWVAEADQRAATSLTERLIELPGNSITLAGPDSAETPVVHADPSSPAEHIASDLRAAIRCGALGPGEVLPTVKELASRYSVAPSTAHRAISALAAAGQVTVARGRRAAVADGSSGVSARELR